MDLTKAILELKENTSKLVERMATQSDKWDQQVKDLVNYGKSQIDGFIAGARGEFPVINLFPFTRDFGYTQDYDSNIPSPKGIYFWIANGSIQLNKVRSKTPDDVANGLLQEYNYQPLGTIRILKVTYSSNSEPAQFAFPVAIGPQLFMLSGLITFQFFYRYISHSGNLPDMSSLDDSNTWTDGKWHFQRKTVDMTGNLYKAYWLFTPTLPADSSLTIEVACIQAIAGKPSKIDRYVDPITAY